jgi:hypothetical protein
MVSSKDEDNTTSARTDGIDSRSFGAMLRTLRESYPERVGHARPGTALGNTKLSAAGLIKCLESHGVSMSSGAYSEIENGLSLPKNPKLFLEAVIVCLELSSKEADALIDQLGYDIVRSKLGDDIAVRHFKRR